MRKVVIIGYGSAGKRHAKILKKYFKRFKIYIFTKQKIKNFETFNKLINIKKIDPYYIIIASETIQHLNQLKFLEKNFKNKKILIEKPLFHKFNNLTKKRNYLYINYNLRFHPYIEKLQKIMKQKKVYDFKMITNSFLPDWRKNNNFKSNYAINKSKGGGVILDLSHELDLINNFFKKIKLTFVEYGKKSNLTKDTEDYLKLSAKVKNVSISLDLNYYSKNELRLLLVDGDGFSVKIDLKKNIFIYKNKDKIYKFNKNYSQDYTFLKTHKAIIYGQKKKQLCKFKDALNVLRIIKKIKNNKKN